MKDKKALQVKDNEKNGQRVILTLTPPEDLVVVDLLWFNSSPRCRCPPEHHLVRGDQAWNDQPQRETLLFSLVLSDSHTFTLTAQMWK